MASGIDEGAAVFVGGLDWRGRTNRREQSKAWGGPCFGWDLGRCLDCLYLWLRLLSQPCSGRRVSRDGRATSTRGPGEVYLSAQARHSTNWGAERAIDELGKVRGLGDCPWVSWPGGRD